MAAGKSAIKGEPKGWLINMDKSDFCRAVNWYPVLSEYSVMTGFLKLNTEEVKLLADGIAEGKAVAQVVRRLKKFMRGGAFDNYFISTDYCAPTDTERFAGKRGAVHSAESAWYYLATSDKVRAAAAAGEIEYLIVRPFVRIDRTREFRLFIQDGKLRAMCQYNLVRHFRRLEGIKQELYSTVEKWFNELGELPIKDLTMDIYLDNDDRDVRIIDLNPWGGTTDPLLLRTFDQDWSQVSGIKLMLRRLRSPAMWK